MPIILTEASRSPSVTGSLERMSHHERCSQNVASCRLRNDARPRAELHDAKGHACADPHDNSTPRAPVNPRGPIRPVDLRAADDISWAPRGRATSTPLSAAAYTSVPMRENAAKFSLCLIYSHAQIAAQAGARAPHRISSSPFPFRAAKSPTLKKPRGNLCPAKCPGNPLMFTISRGAP
jgi:hypothetical protein